MYFLPSFFPDATVVIDSQTHTNLQIEADIVDIAMDFTVSPGQLPGIPKFDIEEFKYAKFVVQGLESNDPLVHALAESYITIMNRKARYMLTTSIRPILEEELKNFKMV